MANKLHIPSGISRVSVFLQIDHGDDHQGMAGQEFPWIDQGNPHRQLVGK